MVYKKQLLSAACVLMLLFGIATPSAAAKTSEYDKIVRHLKTNYQAKKVKVPFMWLAKFAVRVARPAGVKSFNVTLFENLQISRDTLDAEMQSTLQNSFGPEWTPIFRIRSREGQNAYMYIRESGKNVKITVVTVEKTQAAVIRATFSPEKLVEFINEPSIFGISLGDGNEKQNGDAHD